MSRHSEIANESRHIQEELPDMTESQELSHHGLSPLNVVDEEMDDFGVEDGDSEQETANSPSSDWAAADFYPTTADGGGSFPDEWSKFSGFASFEEVERTLNEVCEETKIPAGPSNLKGSRVRLSVKQTRIQPHKNYQGSISKIFAGHLEFPFRRVVDQNTFEEPHKNDASNQGAERSITIGRTASALSDTNEQEVPDNLANVAEDEYEEEEDKQWKSALKVYAKSFLVVALAIMESVTFLFFQIIKDGNLVFCEFRANQTIVNVAHVELMMSIIVLHCISLAASGRKAGWRRNLSLIGFKEMISSVTCWFVPILVCSVVMILVCISECPSSNDTSRMSTRISNALHMSRILLAILRSLQLEKQLRRQLQTAISGRRRRFYDLNNDFDLDITYVCDRLIAMSIPCVAGAMHRNDIRDVARFFATRHYASFVVHNLCESFEENGNGNYDPRFLYYQVKKIPTRDHNVNSLLRIIVFCEQATKILNEDNDNVIVIHCKGGKGRTGTFCCALMLWTGFVLSASDALNYFAERRTEGSSQHKGRICVTAPSQVRYVNYVHAIVDRQVDFISKKHLVLGSIIIAGIPRAQQGGCLLSFVIECDGRVQYDHGKTNGLVSCTGEPRESVIDIGFELLTGDISIRFYWFESTVPPLAICGKTARVLQGGKRVQYDNIFGKSLFFVSFHTSFIMENEMFFKKSEIDGAYNKPSTKFDDDFAIRLRMWEGLGSKSKPEDSAISDNSYLDALQRQRFHWGMILSLPHALRELRIQDEVQRIFAQCCPIAQTFGKGEMIYSPVLSSGGRQLFLIVSGIVMLDVGGKFRTSKKDTDLPGIVLGAGDFFGDLSFFLGPDEDNSCDHVKAYSAAVKVRSICVENKNAGPPLQINSLTDIDLDILYHALARESTAKSAVYERHLAESTVMADLKRDKKKFAIEAEIEAIIKGIRQKQKIPAAQPYLFSTSASMQRSWAPVRKSSLVQDSNGVMVIFPEMVCFADSSSDVNFPINEITSVTVKSEMLTIFARPVKRVDAGGTSDESSPRASAYSTDSMLESPRNKRRVERLSPNNRSRQIRLKRYSYSSDNVKQHLENEAAKKVEPVDPRPVRNRKNFGGSLRSLLPGKQLEEDSEFVEAYRFWIVSRQTALAARDMIRGLLKKTQVEALERNFFKNSEREHLERIIFQFELVSGNELINEHDLDNILEFLERCPLLRFQAGETIAERGSLRKAIFFILQGSVTARADRDRVMSKRRSGELFGGGNLFGLGNVGFLYQMVAEEDAVCLEISHDVLETVRLRQPTLAARINRSIALRACRKIQSQLGKLYLS